MWIPEPIYRKLPAVYVVAGASLIPAFGFSGPSAISALMLFAAAGLTALWRYRHQSTGTPVEPIKSEVHKEWAQRRARRLQSMRFD